MEPQHLKILEMSEDERPVAAQVFGSDPEVVAWARIEPRADLKHKRDVRFEGGQEQEECALMRRRTNCAYSGRVKAAWTCQ